MIAPTIMIQGTASSVGKSLITTALCRLYTERGLKVAPFKAQNMALNAYVTAEGHEIGRAQAAQAFACKIPPTSLMNPVLLKPEGDRRSQVIVLGESWGSMGAAEYHDIKPKLRSIIQDSLTTLRNNYDLVVIEGAGSPAEINLKQNDIVNMFVARTSHTPVLLVGDIDRGGVFAAFVGTLALLDPDERELIKGFLINKFRGDMSLLTPGVNFLESHTRLPVMGVLPYLKDHRLAEEDSLGIETSSQGFHDRQHKTLKIAAIRLPRISNFDEFLPLIHDPGIEFMFIEDPKLLQGAHLVIIPGTKNTLEDLDWLRSTGFAETIIARQRHSEKVGIPAPLLGICGGAQLLGTQIDDRAGIETSGRIDQGLGLLPIKTEFRKQKRTTQTSLNMAGPRSWLTPKPDLEQTFSGYEIHAGQTSPDLEVPGTYGLFSINPSNGTAVERTIDGAMSMAGDVIGTMVHGLFEDQKFYQMVISSLRSMFHLEQFDASSPSDEHDVYTALAAHLRANIDIKRLDDVIFGTHKRPGS